MSELITDNGSVASSGVVLMHLYQSAWQANESFQLVQTSTAAAEQQASEKTINPVVKALFDRSDLNFDYIQALSEEQLSAFGRNVLEAEIEFQAAERAREAAKSVLTSANDSLAEFARAAVGKTVTVESLDDYPDAIYWDSWPQEGFMRDMLANRSLPSIRGKVDSPTPYNAASQLVVRPAGLHSLVGGSFSVEPLSQTGQPTVRVTFED